MKQNLTIVMPVRNRAEIVGDTLDSIARQSVHDFKVILVDNNSSDGTPDVLRGWAGRQPFEVKVMTEMTPGAASARQCGLDAVDTDWTLFFDSDDIMLPRHIESALQTLERNPEADLIGWDVIYRYGDREIKRDFATHDVQYRSFFNGTMATLRYMCRTAVLQRAGGWNPRIGLWDDIELGARILKLRPRMVKRSGAPEVVAITRSDSMSMAEGSGQLDIPMIRKAIDAIIATVGADKSHWGALKLMILAAFEPPASAKTLREEIVSSSSFMRGLLLRFAYFYTRMGGRGIARILRPFM